MFANVRSKDVVGGGLVPLALEGGHVSECAKGRLVLVVSNHREYASGERERLFTNRQRNCRGRTKIPQRRTQHTGAAFAYGGISIFFLSQAVESQMVRFRD